MSQFSQPMEGVGAPFTTINPGGMPAESSINTLERVKQADLERRQQAALQAAQIAENKRSQMQQEKLSREQMAISQKEAEKNRNFEEQENFKNRQQQLDLETKRMEREDQRKKDEIFHRQKTERMAAILADFDSQEMRLKEEYNDLLDKGSVEEAEAIASQLAALDEQRSRVDGDLTNMNAARTLMFELLNDENGAALLEFISNNEKLNIRQEQTLRANLLEAMRPSTQNLGDAPKGFQSPERPKSFQEDSRQASGDGVIAVNPDLVRAPVGREVGPGGMVTDQRGMLGTGEYDRVKGLIYEFMGLPITDGDGSATRMVGNLFDALLVLSNDAEMLRGEENLMARNAARQRVASLYEELDDMDVVDMAVFERAIGIIGEVFQGSSDALKAGEAAATERSGTEKLKVDTSKPGWAALQNLGTSLGAVKIRQRGEDGGRTGELKFAGGSMRYDDRYSTVKNTYINLMQTLTASENLEELFVMMQARNVGNLEQKLRDMNNEDAADAIAAMNDKVRRVFLEGIEERLGSMYTNPQIQRLRAQAVQRGVPLGQLAKGENEVELLREKEELEKKIRELETSKAGRLASRRKETADELRRLRSALDENRKRSVERIQGASEADDLFGVDTREWRR
jgi:hypothetical protein